MVLRSPSKRCGRIQLRSIDRGIRLMPATRQLSIRYDRFVAAPKIIPALRAAAKCSKHLRPPRWPDCLPWAFGTCSSGWSRNLQPIVQPNPTRASHAHVFSGGSLSLDDLGLSIQRGFSGMSPPANRSAVCSAASIVLSSCSARLFIASSKPGISFKATTRSSRLARRSSNGVSRFLKL